MKLRFAQYQLVSCLILIILAATTIAEAAQRRQNTQKAGTKEPPAATTTQPTAQPPQAPQGMMVLNVTDIVDKVNDVVVNIQSGTEDGGTSFGSGFFIDD